MNEQKAIMGALAMDLKRVALSLHRGSYKTAEIFKKEALERASELQDLGMGDYIRNLILKMRKTLAENDEKAAEDALMYSTLFQNFALKKK